MKNHQNTEPSRLTGIEVPVEYNQRTATGMMIENSPDARPQSGLSRRWGGYEAVAEGGITRFLAIFQDNLPEYAGPVRSVRPYYLDFVVPYDAGISHVGGSGPALQQIRNEVLKAIKMIASEFISILAKRSRYAPHNMYTSVVKLKEIEKQKAGPSMKDSFEAEKTRPQQHPNAKTINIDMSR